MAKARKTLRLRIPAYKAPRNDWRRKISGIAMAEAEKRGVTYTSADRLEVTVRLYMDEASLRSHDVDNRLKDVLDSLQGRAGGPKTTKSLPVLIPNDWQVFRVVVEKGKPPKQSHGLGHVTIRKLGRR